MPADLLQEMFLPLLRYAEFSGRSRRREYWLYALMWMVVSLGMLMVLFGSFAFMTDPVAMLSSATDFLIVFGLWWLATIIPSLAVTVRRLHDINLSGWFILIQLIPYIGGLILFVLTLLDGTKGHNLYGPDPKGRGNHWWEGDDGLPAEYRQPARTTGGQAAAPASGNAIQRPSFGRRVAPTYHVDLGNPDQAAASREKWRRRLDEQWD